MRTIIILGFLLPFSAFSSIVGITTHPLNEDARILSAEMTGYMSQRNEMGAGVRYTQEVDKNKTLDINVSGAQNSRGLTIGSGLDLAILDEDVSQPRFSVKPHIQLKKFENETQTLIGAAPTLRKGFSFKEQEFFPYIALPSGLRVDSTTSEFVYYATITLGASLAIPGAQNKLLLSAEANRDMGATSDSIGVLVSWVWK